MLCTENFYERTERSVGKGKRRETLRKVRVEKKGGSLVLD